MTAGEVSQVEASPDRVIDTSGFVSLDTHEHSELSIDSNLLVEDRVFAVLAEGLEVFVLTDHDHFGTVQPLVESLGLADQVQCITGNEVSPLYGHQVGAGCELPPYDHYFTLNWTVYDENQDFVRSKTPSEIWTAMHDEFGCSFVAVAHPYCSQAMFEYFGIDETMDPATLDPQVIDLTLLDAVELINSHDEWEEIFTQNLPGWFNLLNRGYLLPAVGGSDSHQISQTVGHPRNLVVSDTDVPGAVDGQLLLDALKGFKSEIYGGPFIRFTVNGLGPGETVVDTDGEVLLDLKVYAPLWMDVHYVRVFANGELLYELAPEGGDILRLDVDLKVELAMDTYYVVAAGSETSTLGPVAKGRPPISLTNPVWVDADGNGFEPPLRTAP